MAMNEDWLRAEIARYQDIYGARYLDNWEETEIYVAPTLSEAWVKARPEDAYKFEDLKFKAFVDRATGKWLEPHRENDPYKVILSGSTEKDSDDLLIRLVHELSHVCTYKKAVEGVPFSERHPGTPFFIDCSEFRAVYEETRFQMLVTMHGGELTGRDLFYAMAGLLGMKTSDAVAGLQVARADKNEHDVRYFMARYVGASRALRDIDIEQRVHPLFQLWHMTPDDIICAYHMAFYLGNEWSECDLSIDSQPREYYYREFCGSIEEYLNCRYVRLHREFVN